MFTQERIRFCLAKHPEWTDKRVAKSMATTQAMVREIRLPSPLIPQDEAPVPTGGNGKDAGTVDLSSVLKRYDIKAAILNELSALPEGKLIAEDELCRRAAGTDKNRFRRTVENNPDELNQLRIKLRLDAASEGKWFWGRASDVAAALKIRDL